MHDLQTIKKMNALTKKKSREHMTGSTPVEISKGLWLFGSGYEVAVHDSPNHPGDKTRLLFRVVLKKERVPSGGRISRQFFQLFTRDGKHTGFPEVGREVVLAETRSLGVPGFARILDSLYGKEI